MLTNTVNMFVSRLCRAKAGREGKTSLGAAAPPSPLATCLGSLSDPNWIQGPTSKRRQGESDSKQGSGMGQNCC